MDNVALLGRNSSSSNNASLNDTSTASTPTMAPMSGMSARITVSIFLMLFIIVGNALVILAYNRNHRLRTGTYTFLVSLAMSDFLVGSVSLPLWIYISLVGYQNIDPNVYLFFICFDIFSALASTFHLIAVSIERFVAISRPFLYQRSTWRPYAISIFLAWSLAFVLATLSPRILTSVPQLLYYQIHGITVFTLGYLTPLFIISAVNIGIFKIARDIVMRSPQRRESRANSVVKTTENIIQRRIPKERKTAITLIMVTGLFFSAWLPFFIVNMLTLYCLQTCFPQDNKAIYMIVEFTKWCHYSNSAANAVVYAFRDVEMRRTFMSLLFPCFCRHRSQIEPSTFDTNALRTRNDSSISANANGTPSNNTNKERSNNNKRRSNTDVQL